MQAANGDSLKAAAESQLRSEAMHTGDLQCPLLQGISL